jgi:hypothetical protein
VRQPDAANVQDCGMVVSAPRGFWSYVHKDDEAEGGRIVSLARDVISQYEMITGETIDLFLDRDSLEWGDQWRSQVDASLSTVAFFIPVLTPRYFQSVECRRELNFFLRRATRLGIGDLVMPILYIEVPGLNDDAPQDQAMSLVKPFQYESWIERRFDDRTSPEYRRAVAALAQRLAAANIRLAQVDVAAAAQSLVEASGEDDEPGLLDRLELAESAMPAWAETMNAIGKEIQVIGELMETATTDLGKADKQGRGFAGRLTLLRRLSGDLKGHAVAIHNYGEEFARQLNEVDQGIRILIDRAPAEIKENPNSRKDYCELFESLRTMAAASEEGLGALKGMTESIAPIESMSRDLRPSLRQLRQGLTRMYEGREVIRTWLELIDESGIDCYD